MIKIVLWSAILLSTINLNAQIKVHDNGKVSVNHIGDTPEGQLYVNGNTQLDCGVAGAFSLNVGGIVRNKSAASFFTVFDDEVYGSSVVTYIKNNQTKNYVLDNNGDAVFFVDGTGIAFAFGNVVKPVLETDVSSLEDVQKQLLGLSTFQNNQINLQSFGITLKSIEDNIPKAIREFEGEKYIDYNSLVALLIEANNEQQDTIELLKKIILKLTNPIFLKENELSKELKNLIEQL